MPKQIKNRIEEVGNTKQSSKKTIKKLGDKKVESKKNIFRPDSNQTEILIKAGRMVAKEAVRVSKALGLSITYIKNGNLIRESADGHEEIIKVKEKNGSSKVKKGIILNAR